MADPDAVRARQREATRRYRARQRAARGPVRPTPRGPASNRVMLEVGQRFGRLTVLSLSDQRAAGGGLQWVCRCDCGQVVTAWGTALRRATTMSCGCQRRDRAAERQLVHGLRDRPEYPIWLRMRQRCMNPRATGYANYGGRGIAVCPAWDSFEQFLADVGPRPSLGHSLDRIDNDGPYAPGNVRWATRREQSRNTRVARVLTFRGETAPLADWADRLGIPASTLRDRLMRYGWTVERALTTPSAPKRTS